MKGVVEKGAEQSIANQRGTTAKMLAMHFGQDVFSVFGLIFKYNIESVGCVSTHQ